MKIIILLLYLFSIVILLNDNNSYFYNINIKEIKYELSYNTFSILKIKLICKNIILKKIAFNAYLKSNSKGNAFLLKCLNINKHLIKCLLSKKNITFNIKDKYYFYFNFSNTYKLTINNNKIFEDKNRISLIFKPEILDNQIMYKNDRKIIVKTNNNIVSNGFLFIVREKKKILKRPEDGFNKNIELNNFISHAGLSAYRPQSSFLAYKEAIRRGFKIVDADIQFTKDKIPVICHGKILEEISNGKGLLTSKSLKELRKLDFGNKEFKNVKIMTFEDLLKLCKENNIIIDLDLFHMDFKKYFNETDEYAEIIINIVKKYNYFDSIIFNSGHNIEKIIKLKKIKKDITISIDDTNKKIDIDRIKNKFNDSKRIIYNMGNLLYGNNIDEDTVKYGLSLGHKIKAAKVNNLEFANTILKWGVNYITTQYLHPFMINNEKEEPIKIECKSTVFNNLSKCKLNKNIELKDNEIYNIYYSENIYNLSDNINEIPIGKFKYLNTNFNNKLFYTIKYMNFSKGFVQLYISNIIKKGDKIKGIIGPKYDKVAKCYQYNFICKGRKKNIVNCKILKNEFDKIEFDGNYSIYYLENYTFDDKEINALKFNKNKYFYDIFLNSIIILLILFIFKIIYIKKLYNNIFSLVKKIYNKHFTF